MGLLAIAGVPNPWFSWSYLTQHVSVLVAATRQHVALTFWAVLVGLLVAVPLAVVARWLPRTRTPILTAAGVIYTIPSLALFVALETYFGLQPITVEIALVGYALIILVRNTLAGLDAVPAEVVEVARGLGYGSLRMLVRIELPLALPAILAGVRVATVSTIALVTVGAVVGNGGLGGLILGGLNTLYRAQIMTASLLCVGLAVVADLLLLGVQHLIIPWARSSRGGRA